MDSQVGSDPARPRRNPARMRLTYMPALICVLVCGCGGPAPLQLVSNPDPSGKIPAIKTAVRQRDTSAARQLVKDLDSDDDAVRFYAIGGLRRLTGETFGYRYYDDEDARAPALHRWRQWLEDTHPKGAPPENRGG